MCSFNTCAIEVVAWAGLGNVVVDEIGGGNAVVVDTIGGGSVVVVDKIGGGNSLVVDWTGGILVGVGVEVGVEDLLTGLSFTLK